MPQLCANREALPQAWVVVVYSESINMMLYIYISWIRIQKIVEQINRGHKNKIMERQEVENDEDAAKSLTVETTRGLQVEVNQSVSHLRK